MDYQTLDLTLKASALGLSVVNFWWLVAITLGNKGRATKEAIERVEKTANDKHAEQEARLIRLEEATRHAITLAELNKALGPLYDLGRNNENTLSSVKSEVRKLAEQQRDFTNMILERGLAK